MSILDKLIGILLYSKKSIASVKPVAAAKPATIKNPMEKQASVSKPDESVKPNVSAPEFEKKPEYDFTTPGFTHRVTTGAAVVFNKPEENIHQVIVNHGRRFEKFPGIVQGTWTKYIVGKYDFDAGWVRFRTEFQNHEDGYRCLWTIQPDGRYWADDGYGAENDAEIILYAEMDANGKFITPFRIYEIDGRCIQEQEPSNDQSQKNSPAENSTGTSVKTREEIHEDNIHITQLVIEHLIEELKDPIEKGDAKGIRYPYCREDKILDSLEKNLVLLKIGKDYKDEVTVQVGVCRNGTDRLYSNYLFEAGKTQETVKAWLMNTDICIPIILDCVKKLSASVDAYWN